MSLNESGAGGGRSSGRPSRQQRGDGRSAEQRSGSGKSKQKQKQPSSLTSRRSQHHLPEHFSPLPVGCTNQDSGSGAPAPRPPPPPPPPPPYQRGRNSSFHSVPSNAVGGGTRGRSLSTARVVQSGQTGLKVGDGKDDEDVAEDEMIARSRSLSMARPYSTSMHSSSMELPLTDGNGKHQSRSRSRSRARGKQYQHGEERDDGNVKEDSNSRSRSLSRSRPYSTSMHSSPKEPPVADANGKRPSRSRSRSRARGKQQQPQPQPGTFGDESPQKLSSRATNSSSKKNRKAKKAPVKSKSITKSSSAAIQQSRTSSPTSRKSSRTVAAEDTPSSHRKSSRSSNDIGRRGRSCSRGRSHSRGRSVDRSRSRSKSTKKTVATNSKSDRSTSAKQPATETERTDRPPSKRKFMVEIGDDGRFLQAFEFSEDGSTPPSSFPKREPAFIENIRKTAERSFAQSRARGGGSESSVVRLATRKLVVESDAEDNILRVLELPSETSILPPSKRRAESPFSQRQESLARVERRAGGSSKRGREREQSPFSKEEADGTPAGSIPAAVTSKNAEDVPSSRKDRENHRGTAEDKNEYIRHPGPIIDSLSRQTSSRSSSSRSSSLSRPRSARHKAYRSRPSRSLSRTGALRLRSSLRDSSVGRAAVRKGSGDSSSPPTVRFALDNDGGTASSQKAAELNVSESSFGSTGSLGSSRVSRGRDRNHKGSDLLSSPATRVALVDGEGASSLKAVGFNESETSFGSTRCYGSIRGSKGRDRSNKSSDLLSPPATRLAHNDGKGASSSKTADLNTSDTSFGSTISSRSSHDSGGRAPLMVARSSCRAGRSRSPPKNDVNVALETSQRSFESMESNKNFVSAKSVSFLVDQQDAGNDIMSAPTSSQKSNQDSPSSTPPPQLPSHGRSDGARDDHDELRPRRLESFGTDQDASLAGSIPSDFRAAYHQGKPVLSSQDHHAHPQHVFPRPSRSLSNISENSNESSMESRRSDQNFESGQDVYERSLAHAALNPQPPPRRGKSKSFLDTSERSNTENDGPMYAIRHDSGESGIDTSDRSDDSRRSVSFATNLQDEGGRKRAAEVERSPNGFASGWTHAYPPPPPPRGRTSSSFHSYGTDECLPEVRRVRSLSRGQAPGVRADDSVSLVIDDSSSLTATGNDQSSSSSRRAPSGQGDGRGGIPSAPPRQTRSLSRTREKVTISNIGFRDVNFDPAASVASSHQGNYHEHKRSTEAFDPDLKKMSVKKSMVSHSTEETFISAVSDAEGTRFTNQTAGAVRVQEEGDPFMNSSLLNSSLTIFLSECDDEEQSLLSDPTISADLLPPGVALQDVQESLMERPSASTRETVKVHVSKEDSNEALRWSSSKEVSKQERRSRIRRMLSRKASTKRQNGTAPVGGPKVNHSLDSSEETRETFVSKDGSSPGVWMEGAQESLLLHQSLAARGWQQQHPDQGSDRSRNKQKSRLSRLLKR